MLWKAVSLSASKNRILFVHTANTEKAGEARCSRPRCILLHAFQSGASSEDNRSRIWRRQKFFSKSRYTRSIFPAWRLQHYHCRLQSSRSRTMLKSNGMGTTVRGSVHRSIGKIYCTTSTRCSTGQHAFHWLQRWRAHRRLGGQSFETWGR